MIIKNDLETSSIPKKTNIEPTIGIPLTSLLNVKIDKKGTIAEIEKNSKIPLINCKKTKNQICTFLLLLKKKNNCKSGSIFFNNCINQLVED